MQRIREWRQSLEQAALPRRRRWQPIAGVVAFYLRRDLIFCVALPDFVLLMARYAEPADR